MNDLDAWRSSYDVYKLAAPDDVEPEVEPEPAEEDERAEAEAAARED